MGSGPSKCGDSKASRLTRWRSTGIVALRDSKLKTFPHEVLDLDKAVRTVDFTCNRIGRVFFEQSWTTEFLSHMRNQGCIIFFIHRAKDSVHVPEDISKLSNMQRLILADNRIERLPTSLRELQSLKLINLDGNRITGLPDEVGQLVRLEQLLVSRNSLTCLPETLGSLKNLQLLNVSNNQLKCLPESIGNCSSLEELQANDNSIEDLPQSVCNLKHLKSLALNSNRVKQLPKTILKDCQALQSISLHNNPISMEQFQQMEGFEEYEARRRKKFDKQIDSNVMMNSNRLDEGVDI